jgi:tetratricopeptide (TPR) repeat protein
MKKVLIFSVLFSLGSTLFAQSLDDIGKMFNNKQLAPAKVAIDKFFADPKNANSADGLYYKGKIYNELSKDPSTPKIDAYNYKIVAFEAFKLQQVNDKKDIRMTFEQYTPYLDLYAGFYDLGVTQFNAKEFTQAYNAFDKALEMEKFILERKYEYAGFKASKLDTSLVLNTASAALNSTDTINAIKYYRIITDFEIVGKNYESVYEFLVLYYNSKGDVDNLNTIIAKAKVAYPQNTFWDAIETANISKSGDKKAIFARYESLLAKDPTNFVNGYNYSIELYNSIYVKDYINIDSATSEKLISVLKATIPNDKGNDANMLLTNHLFNVAADYSSRAALIKETKLTKPADLKKKKDLNAKAIAKMDEMIPYAETSIKYFNAQPKLTVTQKIKYQQVLTFLSDVYDAKSNPKKAAEYNKIKATIQMN